MRRKIPIEERFWAKVEIGGPTDCWPWRAATGTHGYGVIGTGDGGTITTHRLAYLITNGSIPDARGSHGGVVMHTCDNRRCCNPAHLVAGSQADNLRDMHTKGRRKNPGMRPECARTAKLDWEKVREIRRRWGEGERGVSISLDFGVMPSTIWQVATNRTWKEDK